MSLFEHICVQFARQVAVLTKIDDGDTLISSKIHGGALPICHAQYPCTARRRSCYYPTTNKATLALLYTNQTEELDIEGTEAVV